jgi:hypothetical protein
MLNRPGALPVVVGAADVAGAELPPPSPENSDEPGAVVVWVVVLPLVGGVLDAGAAGLPMLNKELPPAFPPVDPAFANKVEAGAVEDAGAALPPPKLKEAMLVGGCEDAGVADGAPRLMPDGLLSGVEDCVAPGALNNDGFGADCTCAPAVGA